MTHEEIIRLAREARINIDENSVAMYMSNLFRFADLVAAAEREACARLAENETNFDSTECGIDVANDVAAAIRSRGGK